MEAHGIASTLGGEKVKTRQRTVQKVARIVSHGKVYVLSAAVLYLCVKLMIPLI